MALATECGTDVEVESGRTEWETVYAQQDGTMRLEASATAVRAEVDGEWAPVDPRVVAGDGGLQVAAPVVPMVFSDGTDGVPLVTMERDGHELTFDVPLGLPAPEVDGSRLTYAEVLPGVDLLVTVNGDATGFSEVLRVSSPAAAADPRLAELRFPVATSEGLEVRAEAGGFAAVDGEGEPVFSSPTPAMWDSSSTEVEDTSVPLRLGARSFLAPSPVDDSAGMADQDPVDGPAAGDAVAWMPAEVTPDAVTIVPDAAMLADPETVWPLYIDPSITSSRNDWTAVRDAYGPVWRFDPDEGVGLCSRPTSTTCPTTYKSRVIWTFGGLEAIGALTSDQIISATFAAVGTHSYDCTPRPVTLHRVMDPWATTTWPGGTLWEPLSTQVVAHKASCADQPVRWIEFDAIGQARAIADANAAQGSLGLASDESSMANWKRFRNDARFVVVYNRPPTAPTSLKVSSASVTKACGSSTIWMNTRTPDISAVFADPDGGNLHGWFEIRQGTTVLHTTPLLTGRASGSTFTTAVPSGKFVDGGTYNWTGKGVDPYSIWGPAAPYCTVGVDVTRPNAPTVTPVAASGNPVLYAADTWAGGIGQGGGFQIRSTSTDVLSYMYSFNNTALTTSVSGSAPVVTFKPTTAGPQTLRVQAVDRAGNTSDVALHRFNVNIAATTATWMFDEGQGAVAADAGRGGNLNPLAVAGTPTWVNGPLADLADQPADRALRFDTPDDVAATARPVIATHNSFTVMATVKLDAVPVGAATAVSQDGTAASGFQLGYRSTDCAGGATGCWSFAMSTSDAVGTSVLATSTTSANVGEWVHLTGVHDAGNDTLQLYVCALEGDLDPGDPVTTPFTATWDATGPFRVGQARQGTTPTAGFAGAVADVQVLDGVVQPAQIRRACNRVFSNSVDLP